MAGDLKLKQLTYNTTILTDQMDLLRGELKEGFKELVKATEGLDKMKRKKSVGEWRMVKDKSNERPLVRSDADQLLSRINNQGISEKPLDKSEAANLLKRLNVI